MPPRAWPPQGRARPCLTALHRKPSYPAALPPSRSTPPLSSPALHPAARARTQEAKEIIVRFGSFLRHGLIPNKISQDRFPRYNARDVCWWYIKAIQDFIHFTKDAGILKEEITMKYLSDDEYLHNQLAEKGTVKSMRLYDIIQNIFTSHAQGIRFTEWNDGKMLETYENALGTVISLQLDEKTGLIVGGNEFNALTWMDRIGQSFTSQNRGKPATSR